MRPPSGDPHSLDSPLDSPHTKVMSSRHVARGAHACLDESMIGRDLCLGGLLSLVMERRRRLLARSDIKGSPRLAPNNKHDDPVRMTCHYSEQNPQLPPCPLLFAITAILYPLGELSLLLADVHEPGPTVQGSKWTSAIFLVNLTRAISDASVAYSLDFAGPYAPLNRPQILGAEDQAEAHDQCC